MPPTGSAGKPKDSFDRDKLIVSRSYNKDDLELLKKITLKHRPVCHFCNGIVGIVWYEYTTTYREKLFKRHPDKKSCTIVEADEPK